MTDLSRKRALPGDHPKRKWKPEHKAAGYHLRHWDWEELAHDHEVCGEYVDQHGDRLTIRFLEEGYTGGPELELDWENGPTLTVLDATVAAGYIKEHGAVRR